MPTKPSDREALVQGTLDLLILRTRVFGPQHGHGVACSIEMNSRDTLIVDHGSLYPALQRLEKKKWIKARWGTSTNNRRARFYEITAAGRTQLQTEASRWRRIAQAMSHILGPDFAPE